MSPLGTGYHPDAKLPGEWYDHWKDFFHFWSRVERERAKSTNPFSGFFMIVVRAKDAWQAEHGSLAKFRLDPNAYEAIRHVFYAVLVATQQPDELHITPLISWRPDRPLYEDKHLDNILRYHFEGWIEETMTPKLPVFLEKAAVCPSCNLVHWTGTGKEKP